MDNLYLISQMATNGELSDPLCDGVNRGPTLVKLSYFHFWKRHHLWTYCGDVQGSQIERAYFWVLEDVVEYFNRAENPEG